MKRLFKSEEENNEIMQMDGMKWKIHFVFVANSSRMVSTQGDGVRCAYNSVTKGKNSLFQIVMPALRISNCTKY